MSDAGDSPNRSHWSNSVLTSHSHNLWRSILNCIRWWKSSKIDLLAYRCFGVECEGKMQGLMLVNTTNHVGRLESQRGKPLVYVDYLEAAPWNVKELSPKPRYSGVGVRLIEAAVRYSLAEGFAGRVGLHSLPQSERFYEDVCHMTRGDLDSHYEGLCWFELAASKVKAFLGGKP